MRPGTAAASGADLDVAAAAAGPSRAFLGVEEVQDAILLRRWRSRRRTVDLLAQVPYCEAISEQLRSHARQALKAINRFPVAEAEDLVPASAALNPATERAA